MSGHGHPDQPGVRCYCGQHGSLYPAAERARQIGRLRAQRRGYWTDAKNLAEHAASEARTFTPSEQARWENLNLVLNDLDRKLQALMDDAAEHGYVTARTLDGRVVGPLPVDPDLIQTNGKPLYQHLADEAAEQLAAPRPKPRRTRKPCTDCRYWLAGGRRWVYYAGGQQRRCGYCDELAAMRARRRLDERHPPKPVKHLFTPSQLRQSPVAQASLLALIGGALLIAGIVAANAWLLGAATVILLLGNWVREPKR